MERVISLEKKNLWNEWAESKKINYKIKEVSSESRGGYIYSDESANFVQPSNKKRIEGRFVELYCE